jgi:serine/threonine-protein kinase
MGSETAGPVGLVGRVIGGYRLERVLGTGVTGAVLLGRSSDAAGHLAAVRILMLPLQTSAAVRAEFRQALAREAHTLFALRHPHILRVYAFGEDVVADFPYMVLPYMPGGSLAMRLAAGPLPLAEVAGQLAALAGALDEAHGRGIAHGDIKPANVLYDAHGRVQLADFGIARLFETVYGAAAAAGLGQGSAAYIAPEQALGEQVGPAADLYSLGVVLYRMVTGRVPFEGGSPAAVMLKHLQQPPPDPRRFRPELPDAAEAAILRALAKEPSARFPTAAALVEAFTQALPGAGSAEPAESPTADAPSAPAAEAPAAVPLAPAPTAIETPIEPPAQTPTLIQAEQSHVAVAPTENPLAPASVLMELSQDSAPMGWEAQDQAAEADATASCPEGEPQLAHPSIAAPLDTAPVAVEPAAPESPEVPASAISLVSPSGASETRDFAEPEPTVAAPQQAVVLDDPQTPPAETPAEGAPEVEAPPMEDVPAAVEPPDGEAAAEEQQLAPEAASAPDVAPDAADPPPAPEIIPAREPDERPEPSLPSAPAAVAQHAPVPAAQPAALQPAPVPERPSSSPTTIREPDVTPKPDTARAPNEKPWLTPALVRNLMLAIFFGVLVLAAIAVVNVLGILQALLMLVVLALLAFVVLAVPVHAGGSTTPDDAPAPR